MEEREESEQVSKKNKRIGKDKEERENDDAEKRLDKGAMLSLGQKDFFLSLHIFTLN